MSSRTDGHYHISAVLNLHREGLVCISALRSFLQCCEHAEATGLRVQRIAVLDRVDELTRRSFEPFRQSFQTVNISDVGDLGAARNVGTRAASGEYIGVFDGDDLWGKFWLSEAYAMAAKQDSENVYHPELVYYFDSTDFDRQSTNELPRELVQSFFLEHKDSSGSAFFSEGLFFDNMWTSNAFAHRSVYERFPFMVADRDAGFGIEDWSWNYKLLKMGLTHRVVIGTVHLVRVKRFGSLGLQNRVQGLLPSISEAQSVLE